jgi:ferredoxin
VRQDLSDVVTVGDPVEPFVVKDFKRPRTLRTEKGYSQNLLASTALSLVRAYSLKPKVDRKKCTGCGQCVRICPRNTIALIDGKARIDAGRCIRCYCCHEMCSYKAIALRRSMGGRAMAKLVERGPRRKQHGPE